MASAVAGDRPSVMGLGPIRRKVLQRTGTLADMDLIGLNESCWPKHRLHP
jgi:hypothetical protein